MTRTHAAKVLLALGHLVLVACGAAGLVPAPKGTLAYEGLGLYGEYSGSSNGYGFFAPSVGSAWRADLSIYGGGEGRVEAAGLEGNREVRLRAGTILGGLAKDELRPVIAASWAARAFGRDARAELINVHVRVHDLPTMAEYRAGRRPDWLTVKVYSFTHEPTE